ncbi:MAG: class I SAM-dependent methyltransferase [bacterium]|nr:class I SAM-dependent methyltransferase [Candidatus Kapabacteria bacterium]
MKISGSVEQYCIGCRGLREHLLEPLAITPDSPEYSDHHIAACATCGLRSSYPMPNREQLRQWYSDGRGVPPDANEVSGPRAVWHRTHDRYMVNLLEKFAPSGLLVDVGAGSGRFVRAARELGRWSIIATELAEDSIASLRREGFDARLGNLDEVGIADHSVDVVWASHVMEHVPDVEAFLSSVRRVLKPSGHLAALLPSEGSLRARLKLSTWHLVNPPGHLWAFRPATFRKVLEGNGFDVKLTREIHVVCEMVCIARTTAHVL